MWSLYSGPYHLLYSSNREDEIRNRLFDVGQDPNERSPIDDPEEIARLRDLLFQIQEGMDRQLESLPTPLRIDGNLSPELRERLKALGYIGG